MKYYLFGGMSAAFLLFGFSYLYGLTGDDEPGIADSVPDYAGWAKPAVFMSRGFW